MGKTAAGPSPTSSIRTAMWKLSISVLFATALATAAAREGPVEGRWLTHEKTAVVEIFRCGEDGLCGRLVWFRMKPTDHNPQALDIHNPTPVLRDRPLCGLVMMWGFQREGENMWSRGSLYDPESGNTYRG